MCADVELTSNLWKFVRIKGMVVDKSRWQKLRNKTQYDINDNTISRNMQKAQNKETPLCYLDFLFLPFTEVFAAAISLLQATFSFITFFNLSFSAFVFLSSMPLA